MKKRIIVSLLLITLLFTSGCSMINKAKSGKKMVEDVIEKIPLMKYGVFKDIVLDKVKSIDYTRLTEAGRNDETITDKEKIKSIYNSLKNKAIGKEVSSACDDNTTIYSFNMTNGKKVNVEIECDWLVVGNKRFELK